MVIAIALNGMDVNGSRNVAVADGAFLANAGNAADIVLTSDAGVVEGDAEPPPL